MISKREWARSFSLVISYQHKKSLHSGVPQSPRELNKNKTR